MTSAQRKQACPARKGASAPLQNKRITNQRTMQLQQTIDQASQNVHLAQVFANTYGGKLPSDLPGGLSLHGDRPSFGIYGKLRSFGFITPENRERILALIGDVFGRDGWTRKTNYDRDGFDWTKDVEGVRVTINDAETMQDPREGSPVLPACFPILLPETAEVRE